MAEQDDSNVCGNSSHDSDCQLRGDEKNSCRRDSSTSGHNTYTIHSSNDVQTTVRPEPLLLKLDERQRLARERREEREKQMAARETQLLEREERARQYYERQIEERRRRLEDQRLKEERRHTAVEEKRRLKLEEERVRYEAVVMRTMERSLRTRPKSNRWSWGGTLTTSTSHNSDVDRRSVSTMNLSKHMEPVMTKRLSSSSATLLNSPDKALQKQTSRSSSCLVNKVQSKTRASREKVHQDRPAGMRRMPLTPWENTVVSRLQTPTHSYLARSRSAMSLSGDAVTPVCPRSASCHPPCLLSFKTLQSRSAERPVRTSLGLERPIRAGHVQDSITSRKTTHNIKVDRKDKDSVRKSWSNLSSPTPTLTPTNIKRAPSPSSQRNKVSQPSPIRSSTKPPQKPSISTRSRSPPPPASMPLSCSNPSMSSGKLRPIQVSSETLRATPEGEQGKEEQEKEAKNIKKEEQSFKAEDVKKQDDEAQQGKVAQRENPVKAAAEDTAPKAETASERVSSPPSARPSAGTTDPEEASRLLTEKRRQAREQREREEEERRQQEEAERHHREEMARRKAEEKAKREEEAQRFAEEKKLREEEEEKRLAEEKLQREKEEAERLQKQKEEEEARQREETERLRLEREKHFQKEEAERLERKKRLEEIMKRTRRPDQKSPNQKNGDVSQQQRQDSVNLTTEIPSITVSSPQQSLEASEHSDSNGHPESTLSSLSVPPAADSVSPDAQLKENGVVMDTQVFEEVIEVPMVTKLSRTEGDGEEEDGRRRSPLLAFTENGTAHDTLEHSQVQQPADSEV